MHKKERHENEYIRFKNINNKLIIYMITYIFKIIHILLLYNLYIIHKF